MALFAERDTRPRLRLSTRAFHSHTAHTSSCPPHTQATLAIRRRGELGGMPQPVEGIDGNWRCTNCNNINFGTRAQCNRCGASRAHAAANPALNPLMILPDGTAGKQQLIATTSSKDARGVNLRLPHSYV